VTDWGVVIFTCEGGRREKNRIHTHTHRIPVSVTVTVSGYQPCEPILQLIIIACITNSAIGLQYDSITGLMGMCNQRALVIVHLKQRIAKLTQHLHIDELASYMFSF
jgi:hypothetical protein